MTTKQSIIKELSYLVNLGDIIKNIIFLICAIIVLLLYVPQFIFDSLSDLIETIGKDFEIQAQKIINYIDNI